MECTFPPCHSGSSSAIARTMPSSSLFGLCRICDQSGQNNRETNHYQVSHNVAPSGHVRLLSEQLLHQGSCDIGEAEVSALEAIRQLCVLQPHEVQHSRMQV